jgi:hypothetical protein
MGVRNTAAENKVALFDSVTGTAFGPVFDDEMQCDAFMEWMTSEREVDDARALSASELEGLHAEWCDLVDAG